MNTIHTAGWFEDGRRRTKRDGTAPQVRVRGLCSLGACAALLMVAGGGCAGSNSGVSLSKFCADFARPEVSTIIVAQLHNSLAPPSKQALQVVAPEVRKIAGEAPASLKADLKAVYDGVFVENPDDEDASVAISRNGKASRGYDRVAAFADSNCHVGS
jgi:hypothetical protein